MNIIKFAIENPVKVIVGIFFIVIFGIQALFNMPYRLIPTIEYPQITVRTTWVGASPYEMEKEIIDRQERVLKTIPGLIDFESNASNGFASITLMFDLDMDINDAVLSVLNKLNEVRGYPDDIDEPTIRSSNSDSISVIELALTTTDDNPKSIDEYGTYFEEIVKPYLERVNGVADLSYWGGSPKQIQIKINPNSLSYYNLNISDIIKALSDENVNISAGTLDFGSRDYRFRTIGEVKSPEDIKELVVVAGKNNRIKMGDIAEIDYGFEKKNTVVKLDTKDAINVGVIAQAGADVLQLTNDIDDVIQRLNNGILKEQGIEFVWISDQRGYILKAIGLVKSNIAVGGILAIIVLLLFLRSIRSTLVIATTIPICVVGTFFIMNIFGKSLNVISLAGIAFSVGMLIDNSIVVLENIDRHLSMGKKAIVAAYDGVKEVWGAILASTLTTIAVFLPVVFIKEEAGQLFGDIALAVSSAVGLSLIVSVLVIPVFTRLLYSKNATKRENNNLDNAIINFGSFFVNGIMFLSRKINSKVSYRLIVIISLTIFSVVGAYLLFPKMDYLPLGNKNLVESRISVPPGFSYKERADMGQYIYEQLKPYMEKEIDGLPAIRTFLFVGGTTFVRLSVTSQDDTRAKELQPLLSKIISTIPGITASTAQSPLFNIGRGSGNMVMLNISGAMAYEELTEKVNIIHDKILEVLPFVQMRVNPTATPLYPEVQIFPDREALKAAGITANDLGIAVDAYLDGKKIGEFKDDELGTIDISVMGQDEFTPENPEGIYSILVTAQNGQPVPIYTLAEMQEIMGVERIRRYNSQRSFTLMISVHSGMVLEELQNAIMDKAIEPLRKEGLIDGIEIYTSGASSKLEDAKEALTGNLLLAVLITYLLMSALFNNFLYPFIIMVSVPLAASGGFLGLAAVNTFITNQPMDVLTVLGFIMLIGTVVNNPILIVYQSLNNVRYGMKAKDAIDDALRTRIRPICMSTLTSLISLFPLVLTPGAGAELYRGLGAVILGGLAFSTVLTMFVIPAILSFFLKDKDMGSEHII